MTPKQRFFAMRLRAASHWPYAAEAILSLIPVESTSVPRMAIDREWRVYFNPDWLASDELSDEAAMTVVLHEFGHVMRRHFKRFAHMLGYDPADIPANRVTSIQRMQALAWNHATDCEINDDLAAEGLPIENLCGGGSVLPKTHNLPTGQTAEQYYETIVKKFQQQHDETQQIIEALKEAFGPGSDSDSGQNSGETGDSTGDSGAGTAGGGAAGQQSGDRSQSQGGDDQAKDGSGSDNSEGGASGNGNSQQDPSGGSQSGGGGDDPAQQSDGNDAGAGGVDWQEGSSSVDGFRRSWEHGKGSDRENGNGSQEEPAGLTEAEQKHLIKETAKNIEEAAKRGTVPKGLKRWAEKVLRPQVPWAQVLRRTVATSAERMNGCTNRTFSRVSRRTPHRADMVLSSPIANRLKIRVYGDTSGSMGESDLAKIRAETTGVLKSYRDQVEYCSVDARTNEVKKVRSINDIDFIGGGGTDMRLPIYEVAKEKQATKPGVVIIITDGETPWPDEPARGFDVIAVITRKSSWYSEPPSWIKTIHVN